MRIASRVVLVTGASSGIGAELARQLAAEGVKVGLVSRRAEPLDALAATIRATGGTASVAAADVTDRSAVRSAFARVEDELGPIDLLVANAGLGLNTPALNFSAEKVEAMVRVNLLGAVYAIEAVLPAMLDRGEGHLVGISSLAGFRGIPLTSGYSATKAALTSLLESLRIELRGRGIDVTAVHPGYIRTPMIDGSPRSHPFLLEVGPAARIILKGIAARRRQINFPWQPAAVMSLARVIPGGLYDLLASRFLLPRRPAQ